VKLEDEIIYLNNYIELQKLRYQKRVDVTFEHSSDKDYEITPLLFIILMENAFKHGVESVMKDAFVQLCLKANDGVVIFESENNFEISKIEKSAGIGLENLKRRLNLIYPNKYRLDINQSEQTFRAVLKIELK
jgi:LytS/YehU family sensor histidine kinase